MPVYPVLEPLKHNGETYGSGDSVEMAANAAKDLLMLGVVGKPLPQASKAADKSPKPADKAAAQATQEAETPAADLAKSAATGGNEATASAKEEGK